MEERISQVYPSDRRAMAEIDGLLEREGVRRDRNLDYTCAVRDEEERIVATGSCFGNTLRCLAVDQAHRGEGLLNLVVTHLMEVQYSRGNYRLFLYTRERAAKYFQDLGFYEVARAPGRVVFLENRRDGFRRYLQELAASRREGSAAAVVLNANPFTLGHRYLVETAAAACRTLHIFLVSEDVSLVPYVVRRRLVEEGTANIPHIVLHSSGPYIISRATFPSYFLEDEAAVIEGQARLDLAVFGKIGAALGITARYVGAEPSSRVTALYNRVMAEELPRLGISCIEIPRREADGAVVSASIVRRLLQAGRIEEIRRLVPASTYRFFTGPEAGPVLAALRRAGNVIHY